MQVVENATYVFLKVLTVRTHLTSLKAFHTVKIRMTIPRALQKRVQLANDVSRRSNIITLGYVLETTANTRPTVALGPGASR